MPVNKKLKTEKMEFLLQLFADLVGSPVEDEEVSQKNIREKEKKLEIEMPQEEEISEEQILFELMQFH